jgi:uncharacterized membrane protein YphA (DoxX/SURF4 family)
MSSFGTEEMIRYSLQLSVGTVFLTASVFKLADIRAFRSAVAGYGIRPPGLVAVLAPALAFLECIVALALIAGYFVSFAGSVALITLAAFTTGISFNLIRGRRIPCGCFGSRSDAISPRALTRIALLALPTIALLVIGGSTVTARTLIEGEAESLLHLVEAASAAAFFLVVGAWLLALPEVAQALHIPHPWRKSEDMSIA